VRKRLETATTEEQFQAVGLLCRETLVSLAQAVYDAQLHPNLDGVTPSDADAKRMLEAYMGDGKDSCQILTQACDLDDKPGSDETPARSRFLAVH
jgi:hypothetical protein